MTIRGVAHIALLVRSVAAATVFYRDRLGLPVRYADEAYAELDLAEGPALALHQLGDGACPSGDWRGGVLVTLGVDDADEAHDRLVAQGVRVTQPPTDRAWGREVVVRDPDGHQICLLGPRKDGRPATCWGWLLGPAPSCAGAAPVEGGGGGVSEWAGPGRARDA